MNLQTNIPETWRYVFPPFLTETIIPIEDNNISYKTTKKSARALCESVVSQNLYVQKAVMDYIQLTYLYHIYFLLILSSQNISEIKKD